MRPTNLPIISSIVMSANITSSAIPLKQVFMYSIQAVFTGTPTGTFKLQASCDPLLDTMPSAELPTHWSDISSSSIAVSAAGDVMYNVTDVGYNWVRLVYTDGSGGSSTAVLNATFNAKGV